MPPQHPFEPPPNYSPRHGGNRPPPFQRPPAHPPIQIHPRPKARAPSPAILQLRPKANPASRDSAAWHASDASAATEVAQAAASAADTSAGPDAAEADAVGEPSPSSSDAELDELRMRLDDLAMEEETAVAAWRRVAAARARFEVADTGTFIPSMRALEAAWIERDAAADRLNAAISALELARERAFMSREETIAMGEELKAAEEAAKQVWWGPKDPTVSSCERCIVEECMVEGLRERGVSIWSGWQRAPRFRWRGGASLEARAPLAVRRSGCVRTPPQRTNRRPRIGSRADRRSVAALCGCVQTATACAVVVGTSALRLVFVWFLNNASGTSVRFACISNPTSPLVVGGLRSFLFQPPSSPSGRGLPLPLPPPLDLDGAFRERLGWLQERLGEPKMSSKMAQDSLICLNMAPKIVQEAPRPLLDSTNRPNSSPRSPPTRPKSSKSLRNTNEFRLLAFSLPMAIRCLKMAPRGPRAPTGAQESPKTAPGAPTSAPRAPQEGSRMRF